MYIYLSDYTYASWVQVIAYVVVLQLIVQILDILVIIELF